MLLLSYIFASSNCQTTKDKKGETSMKQFVIIPVAGKRLIGKAREINPPYVRFAACDRFVRRNNQ